MDRYNNIGGVTSNITIEDDGTITKHIKKTIEPNISLFDHTCVDRELHILDILSKFDWSPKVISNTDTSITMTNVGERINKYNIPFDAVTQMTNILKDLKSVNVEHNDIKDEEILVKDGKLHLCDYGWASINKDFSCGESNISNKIKPHGIFSDLNAIDICKNILKLKDYELHLIIDWSMTLDVQLIRRAIVGAGLETAIGMNVNCDAPNAASIFYQQQVHDERFKTPFNIYYVLDYDPIYDYRQTTKGNRLVNIKVFDLKQKLRSLAVGKQIHATDNIQETRDNIRTLNSFGVLNDNKYPKKNFKDIGSIFTALNSSEINYVVMRNFEELPNNATIDEHLDIDILTDDYYAVKNIVGGDSVEIHNRYEDGGYRILNWIVVGGKRIMMDIRYVGDNYYSKQFESDMLATKKFDHSRGIWIPNEEYHKYGLIYHALIHKHSISNTYKNIFSNMGHSLSELPSILNDWMNKKNYKFIVPNDKSVAYNIKSIQ